MHRHLSLVSLPHASLVRIGAERCHGHPQRLTHPTGRALRPKHRVAESSPTLLQPLSVVGRSEVWNQLVAELPDAIRQVLARGESGEESDSGLHFTLAAVSLLVRVFQDVEHSAPINTFVRCP